MLPLPPPSHGQLKASASEESSKLSGTPAERLHDRLKLARHNEGDALLDLRQTNRYAAWKKADAELRTSKEYKRWAKAKAEMKELQQEIANLMSDHNVALNKKGMKCRKLGVLPPKEIHCMTSSPATLETQPSSNENSAISAYEQYADDHFPLVLGIPNFSYDDERAQDNQELTEKVQDNGKQKEVEKLEKVDECELQDNEDTIDATVQRLSDRIYARTKGKDEYNYITALAERAVESTIQRLESRLNVVGEALQQRDLTSVKKVASFSEDECSASSSAESVSGSEVSSVISTDCVRKFRVAEGASDGEGTHTVFSDDYSSSDYSSYQSDDEGFFDTLITTGLSSTLKSYFK